MPASKPKAYQCNFCEDKKFIRYDVEIGDPRFGRMFPCPKCNQKAIDAACGLMPHERKITIASIDTDGPEHAGAARMKRMGERFIQRPTGFLSVFGKYGNAKTVLLQGIVNACLAKGIEARYLTAHELLDYLKEAFDPKIMETDIGRIRRLAQIPVLCIDELDKAKDTTWAADMQTHLFNERYRNEAQLGTVFAWNGDFNTLPWPSIVDRLKEFPWVNNQDESLRPAIGAAKEAEYASPYAEAN